MTLQQYARLVQQMRQCQREYFKWRALGDRQAKQWLVASKNAEAKVDNATREILDEQKNLF